MALNPFCEMYLDYVNNFLTVEAFACHYGISVQVAEQIIMAGQLIKAINL